MLSGYKTYIVALLLGAVSAAQYLGYITAELTTTLTTLLMGGRFAFLRAGVASK